MATKTKTKTALIVAISKATKLHAGNAVEIEALVRKAVANHWHWRTLAVQGDCETIEVWEDNGIAPFLAIDVATGGVR